MTRVVIVVAAYIATQLLSDIASLKIVLVMGLSMDAGTFIYPLTFTLRDLVHKTLGASATRVMIIFAAFVNLFMAALFWFVARLPVDPDAGPQPDFGSVLAPVWRIVIASIIAEVISELTDTEVYQIWTRKFKEKHQWGRVISSNTISVPIDSILFSFIAFYGVLPISVVWGIVFSNILIKGGTTLLTWPLIYLIPEKKVKLY